MAEVIVLEDVATDCSGGYSLPLVQGNQEVEVGEAANGTSANKVQSNMLSCEQQQQQLGSAVTLWDV